MSRSYEITVEVENIPVGKAFAVRQACCAEWDFDEKDAQWTDSRTQQALVSEDIIRLEIWAKRRYVGLRLTGTSELGGGELEKEFVERLMQAVWQACGKYVPVRVRALLLDDLPWETYVLDQQAYAAWRRNKKRKPRK
jgi:hypothetical protein